MSKVTGQKRSPTANVPALYVYTFFDNLQLWIPTWVIYLTQYRGLSLSQVTIIEAAFTMSIFAFEMPTGAIADRWGRVLSLRISALVLSVAIFLFGIGDTFPILLASYVAWAVSVSFRSGADQAFLYDTLRSLGRAGEYQKIGGRVIKVAPRLTG